MKYGPQVLDHYENPRNVGRFASGTPNVFAGQAGSTAEGCLIRLQLRIEASRVLEARFQSFGCGYAIASASLLTELVTGLSVGEAARLEPRAIVDALALPADRARFAELSVRALQSSLGALIKEE